MAKRNYINKEANYEKRLEAFLDRQEAILAVKERGTVGAKGITTPDYGLCGLRDLVHIHEGYWGGGFFVWERGWY